MQETKEQICKIKQKLSRNYWFDAECESTIKDQNKKRLKRLGEVRGKAGKITKKLDHLQRRQNKTEEEGSQERN